MLIFNNAAVRETDGPTPPWSTLLTLVYFCMQHVSLLVTQLQRNKLIRIEAITPQKQITILFIDIWAWQWKLLISYCSPGIYASIQSRFSCEGDKYNQWHRTTYISMLQSRYQSIWIAFYYSLFRKFQLNSPAIVEWCAVWCWESHGTNELHCHLIIVSK